MKLFIDIKTKEQLAGALKVFSEVVFIIPPSLLSASLSDAAHRNSNLLFISLPEILRENKAEYAATLLSGTNETDGVVVRNTDELGLIKETGYFGAVMAGSSVYMFNRYAADTLQELFSEAYMIMPDELSDDELGALAAALPSWEKMVYKVYGRQKLMVTAQHISADSFTNTKGDRFITSWDPENEYTVIYYDAPVSMLDKPGELKWDNYIAELSTESGKELQDVYDALKLFESGREAYIKGSVRGYHYRPVD